MALWVVLLMGLVAYWLYWELVGKRDGLPPSATPLPFFGNLLRMDFLVGMGPVEAGGAVGPV